jgi:TRAP-type C4-dicarboxylate transport system permease small subunit
MGVICALAVVILYGAALPATYDYVSFMKVEKSSYLRVPMNWMFSIYVFFCVAIIARYLWQLVRLLRGRGPAETDVTKASSGL